MKHKFSVEVVYVPHPDTERYLDLTRKMLADLVIARAMARVRGEILDEESIDIGPEDEEVALEPKPTRRR